MSMTAVKAVTETKIEGLKLLRRGKVRDCYEFDDKLLLVSTDRLSAFDHILPTPIPDKGKILTQISAFWFLKTKELIPNHFITAELPYIQKLLPSGVKLDPAIFDGRTTLCYKADRIDAECVARGYIAGSGWKEYKAAGKVCGHELPKGLQEASKLPEPIFTPATKNDTGHDENISREELAKAVGPELTQQLERVTLALYTFAQRFLRPRGLLLADTKFEFGRKDGKLILIDEMLTPDSSRVWEEKTYKQGSSPASFDKQFVRDYLETTGWDKQSAPPSLPAEVAEGTAARYREFHERLLK
jgi:phosphoribosylaminoimidazole-succinocarboxamide synthase